MLRRQLGQPEEGTLSMVFDCIMHQTHIQKPMILIEGKKKKERGEKLQLTLINIVLLFFSYLYNPINVDDVCRMFKELLSYLYVRWY
jgi:hypothetical protein